MRLCSNCSGAPEPFIHYGQDEVRKVTEIVIERHRKIIANRQRAQLPPLRKSNDELPRALVGYGGEYAYHLLTGYDWWLEVNGALDLLELDGRQHGPDVGPHGVRATDYEYGSLIVHPPFNRLKPRARWDGDHPLVLAVGKLVQGAASAQYRFPGWTLPVFARSSRFWRSDVAYPCYMVPPRLLHDLPVHEIGMALR